MEDVKKPYEYSCDDECKREETRKEINWYFKQGMTGAEAFRACQLALRRWHEMNLPKDPTIYPYIKYLYDAICETLDVAPEIEFALAIEEMMDERNCVEKGTGKPIHTLPVCGDNIIWQDCTCCDKCIWGPQRKEIK